MDDERKKKYEIELRYRLTGKGGFKDQVANLAIFPLPFKYVAG